MDLSELINLANCLSLYQREHDTGIGLVHTTQVQRALRQYVVQCQGVESVAVLAFRKGFVAEISRQISILVKQAESTTGNELRQIAGEVEKLREWLI